MIPERIKIAPIAILLRDFLVPYPKELKTFTVPEQVKSIPSPAMNNPHMSLSFKK